MADVLNLTLKKDVFESIVNHTNDKILIERTDWWSKRLIDKDTKDFKDFKIARISCGSPEKLDYPISSIELIENNFIINIAREEDNKTMEEEQSDDTQTIEKPKPIVIPVEKEPIIVNHKEPHMVPEKEKSLKELVNLLLDEFCKNKKVINVNYRDVRIMPNGTIIGSNVKLQGDKDSEIRISFNLVKIMKYSEISNIDFLKEIQKKMNFLLKENYVFINRRKCGLVKLETGEDVCVLTVATKRTYLFGR